MSVGRGQHHHTLHCVHTYTNATKIHNFIDCFSLESVGRLRNDKDDGEGNENDTTSLHVHHAFSHISLSAQCRRCITTTWQFFISNRLSFTLPKLRYSLLELNWKKLCKNLTNWTRWSKNNAVWNSANSLYKWRQSGLGLRRCSFSTI